MNNQNLKKGMAFLVVLVVFGGSCKKRKNECICPDIRMKKTHANFR